MQKNVETNKFQKQRKMANVKKQKKISDLVLILKLVRERISDYTRIQERNRREIKKYEKYYMKNVWVEQHLRFLNEDVFEKRVLLNALEKHSIKIKKEIRRLNKEQNFKNNKNGK